MPKKIYAPVLLLACLSLIYCCKKDPPLAPTLTAGSGTFTATVDGLPFNSDPFSVDALTGQYLGDFATVVPGILSQYQLSVIGQKNNPNDTGYTSISLYVSGLAVQTYSSANPQLGTDFCLLSYTHAVADSLVIWKTDSLHTGTVSITKLDTIHNLVSGTFNFTAYSNGTTPATHTITNGSFANVPIEP